MSRVDTHKPPPLVNGSSVKALDRQLHGQTCFRTRQLAVAKSMILLILLSLIVTYIQIKPFGSELSFKNFVMYYFIKKILILFHIILVKVLILNVYFFYFYKYSDRCLWKEFRFLSFARVEKRRCSCVAKKILLKMNQ